MGRFKTRLTLVAIFAIAMAYFEAAVVVYLRQVWYPDGFALPLRIVPGSVLITEIIREFSTLIMIAVVAVMAGTRRWERFGYFIFLFGLWDIFYYVWLKAIIGWPASLLTWDVLFLIPVPWIGPVVAPAAVALIMTIGGWLIARIYGAGGAIRPSVLSWLLALGATVLILYSFMGDTQASLHQAFPRPYHYELLTIGLLLYVVALVLVVRSSLPGGKAQVEGAA